MKTLSEKIKRVTFKTKTITLKTKTRPRQWKCCLEMRQCLETAIQRLFTTYHKYWFTASYAYSLQFLTNSIKNLPNCKENSGTSRPSLPVKTVMVTVYYLRNTTTSPCHQPVYAAQYFIAMDYYKANCNSFQQKCSKNVCTNSAVMPK